MDFKLCEEVPIKLNVNNKVIAVFMSTPSNLEELGVGYLFCKKILKNKNEIIGIGLCESGRNINILLDKKVEIEEAKIIFSSCGSDSDEKCDIIKNINFDFSIKMSDIKNKFLEMMRLSVENKKTGGVHEAFLTNFQKEDDTKNQNVYMQDIGRHNAVDKVIGYGILNEINFSKTILFITGRISSDMVSKAIVAKIPVIISFSIPSDLAYKMAKKAGIVLIGRINSKEPIIYTENKKIIL